MSYRISVEDWKSRHRRADYGLVYRFRRKTCRTCEQDFYGRGFNWDAPFYCSVGCKTKARRLVRAEAREPKKRIKCAQCGERFTPIRSTARFCSTRCRMAAHRAAT